MNKFYTTLTVRGDATAEKAAITALKSFNNHKPWDEMTDDEKLTQRYYGSYNDSEEWGGPNFIDADSGQKAVDIITEVSQQFPGAIFRLLVEGCEDEGPVGSVYITDGYAIDARVSWMSEAARIRSNYDYYYRRMDLNYFYFEHWPLTFSETYFELTPELLKTARPCGSDSLGWNVSVYPDHVKAVTLISQMKTQEDAFALIEKLKSLKFFTNWKAAKKVATAVTAEDMEAVNGTSATAAQHCGLKK